MLSLEVNSGKDMRVQKYKLKTQSSRFPSENTERFYVIIIKEKFLSRK